MKKLVFNDGRSIDIQSISKAEGCIHVRMILTTSEQLKALFMDEFATQRMHVVENGVPGKEAYENYTKLSYLKEETGGIWEVELFQTEASVQERLASAEKKVLEVTEFAQNAEKKIQDMQEEKEKLLEQIDMLTQCLLEMSETVYQ